jgi:ankyrin repeat protein
MEGMKRFPRLLFVVNGVLLVFVVSAVWSGLRARRQEDLNTRLVSAVRMGRDQEVTRLLEQGADADTLFDTSDNRAFPVLPYWQKWLAAWRHEETVSAPDYAPVLSLAATFGRKAIAEQLLAQGANVNTPDGKGSAPLHYAADHNQRDILIDLLDRHADVNHKNKEGNTPLHLAVLQHNLIDAQLLLDHGADINATNTQGRAPLDEVAFMAEEKHREWILRYGENLTLEKPDPPLLITRHFQHQLDLLKPLLDLLHKNGAKASQETNSRLVGSFLLDPHEIEQALKQ